MNCAQGLFPVYSTKFGFLSSLSIFSAKRHAQYKSNQEHLMSQNQEVIDRGALITTPFARAVFLQLNASLSY